MLFINLVPTSKNWEENNAIIDALEAIPENEKKIKVARKKGIRTITINLLEDRFQSSDWIQDLLENIDDVNLLKKIFRIAVKSDSLDAFNIILTELSK